MFPRMYGMSCGAKSSSCKITAQGDLECTGAAKGATVAPSNGFDVYMPVGDVREGFLIGPRGADSLGGVAHKPGKSGVRIRW